jgi:hypothetical protein
MTKHQAIDQINRHLAQMDDKALEGLLMFLESDKSPNPKLTKAGVPYTGDEETDAVLNDHPDILERLKRLESGESKTIPIEDVAKKYGVKL